MGVQTRAYDNEHGDPVVVMVVTGDHDVSRLLHMLDRGNCEQVGYGATLLRQLRRHNGGQAALRLLRDHGGSDFTDERARTSVPLRGTTPMGDAAESAAVSDQLRQEVRRVMAEQGISQAELSRLTGYTTKHINQTLSDQRKHRDVVGTPAFFEAVAAVLSCRWSITLAERITGATTPEPDEAPYERAAKFEAKFPSTPSVLPPPEQTADERCGQLRTFAGSPPRPCGAKRGSHHLGLYGHPFVPASSVTREDETT